MKKVLILITLLALAGCAGIEFQWSASYQTANLAEAVKARKERAQPLPVIEAPEPQPLELLWE